MRIRSIAVRYAFSLRTASSIRLSSLSSRARRNAISSVNIRYIRSSICAVAGTSATKNSPEATPSETMRSTTLCMPSSWHCFIFSRISAPSSR